MISDIGKSSPKPAQPLPPLGISLASLSDGPDSMPNVAPTRKPIVMRVKLLRFGIHVWWLSTPWTWAVGISVEHPVPMPFHPQTRKRLRLGYESNNCGLFKLKVINIKEEEFIDSFLLAILFLPTSIRLRNIWANLSIWMVKHCTRPYKYASLRCLTASEDTHLPWLPLLIEEVRSKTFKARNKLQGSGSSKGTSSTPSCSFLSDMSKWCWQMLTIHQPTMLRPCWGTIPLNWNQRQLGFITLRIVAMNPGCWGRVFSPFLSKPN